MTRLVACALAAVAGCSSGTAPAAAPVVELPGGSPGIGFDDLRYSERLGQVLVPAGRAGALDLIDPATRQVTAIGGFSAMRGYSGGHDDGVTSVDDTGRWLLATDRTAGRLQVIDPVKKAIVTGAPLGGHPDYVRWVAPTSEAWVTEPDREMIEIFTLAADGTPSATATIAVKGGPESLVVDAARSRAYTHLWDGATVAIDLRTRALVATWPNRCDGSRGIALDEDRGFLFAACKSGKLVLMDIEHGGAVKSEVTPVEGSDVIDYRRELGHLYTSGQVSATMAIVGVGAGGTMTVLGKAAAAKGSHCIVGDGRGRIYVCDPARGRILVRDDHFAPAR